ncbi:hypothetical protein [Kribbella sp. NPDC050459]|uniref:hypothetical protein n=1 Tax=Kribbella sp. NPDC050459 TaxID=3155785 RepID=UPI0033E8E56C
MTRLFLVSQGERRLWVAAVLGEDVYCFVPDTGRFHRSDGVRDDFFMEQELAYEAVGVAGARRLIEGGLPALDPEVMADHLAEWRADARALEPEQVFASVVADLR